VIGQKKPKLHLAFFLKKAKGVKKPNWQRCSFALKRQVEKFGSVLFYFVFIAQQ